MTISVIGFTRFSVLSEKGNAFAKTREQSLDSKIKIILNKERLDKRFELFERRLLPSLDGQKAKDFVHVIMASSLLPQAYRERLAKLCANRDYCKIVYVTPQTPLLKIIDSAVADVISPHNGVFISYRIDDDDALAADYVSRLCVYLRNAFKNMYISFSSGFYCNDDPSSPLFVRTRLVNGSAGLAFVSDAKNFRSVHHGAVNHRLVDSLFPTIVDSTKVSWVMSAHEHTDTQRQSRVSFSSDGKPINKVPEISALFRLCNF